MSLAVRNVTFFSIFLAWCGVTQAGVMKSQPVMAGDLSSQGLELARALNFSSMLGVNARLSSNAFAQAIASLSQERFADNGSNVYSYTDRFTYDNQAWMQLIGGYGGYYKSGYSELGGFSLGYDRMLGYHVFLGGYATYAYTRSQNYTFVPNAKESNNLELGAYMRLSIDNHEADWILSEAVGFNSIMPNGGGFVDGRFNNFTTNFTARYGYIIPINPYKGFYVKPLVDVNYLYQYNTKGTSLQLSGSQHSHLVMLGAFLELRKYTGDKKYLYFMPGIQQDVFIYNSNDQIYFASSLANAIAYKMDNQYRTYFTLMAGGELGFKNNAAMTFGIGVRASWDRYFAHANVGLKYKF